MTKKRKLLSLIGSLLVLTGLAFPAGRAEVAPAATEVVVYGDSIAAGFGLPKEDGLVAQLDAALEDRGFNVKLVNGGVSGDTTAGGLARIDWTLAPTTDVVVLILGGNDALRGLTPEESEANLDQLLSAMQTRGLKVLLTGMRAPPNLGAEYAARFEPMYARLAEKHGVALYPFILDGVAADLSLNQADGIHPNAEGVKVMVAGLVPALLPLLDPEDADTLN